MGHDHDHGDLLDELTAHFEPVLDECPEAVYLFVDNENMVCNDKMAKLFGYDSPDEWAMVDDFLGTFVDPKDQEMFGKNYAKQVGHMAGPLRFKFKAVKKDGSTFNAETDMVPIAFGGHAVAYHFVRKA
jgi:PAS domain-containing protein